MSSARRSRLAALTALALAFAPASHAAPSPTPSPIPPPSPPLTPADHLERGRVCFHALDLDCAERELSAAHANRDALPPAARATLLALLAELHLAASRPDPARAHLVELLTLTPNFAPSWPDTWLATLEEARRLAPDKLPPTLTAILPITATAHAPLPITAEAHDPSGLSRVELVIRRDAHQDRSASENRFALSTTDGARFSVTIAPELTAPGRLTLTLQAWDRHGNGPTTFPPAAEPPHTVTFASAIAGPTPSPPITERWWFWATLVGVTGLAVALGFALAPTSDTPSRTGDLGITLELP